MALPRLLWGPPVEGPRRPRVLLGCSGSVATIKVPAIVQQLEQRGAHVIVVPTRSALHFLRAAAEAEARQPPATVVTAGAGDTEVACSCSDVPSTLADATATHQNVSAKIEDREETGFNQSCDTDTNFPFESAIKCNYEESSLALEKVLELNRNQESEDRGRIKEKCCGSKDNSGVEREGSESAVPQCSTEASDNRPTAGTDPLQDKCRCDWEQGSCKCEVGLGNTVQTQTEIAGVSCYLIQDSCDVLVNNSIDKSKLKTDNTSSSIPAYDAPVPSHCLSCLKMLEATALGSFASHTSTTVPGGTSREHKPPSEAWLPSAPGDATSPDSGAKVDTLPASCAWCATQRLLPGLVIAGDALEWEGWRGRGDPVLHIDLRRWADLGIIAPLSANTLAKLANGLCDNLLTCVARAWDTNKPLLFCPAMNTHMYEHPLTARQITALVELGYVEVPAVCKRLVCGDVGGGAMAEVGTIVEAVRGALQQHHEHIAPIPSPVESNQRELHAEL